MHLFILLLVTILVPLINGIDVWKFLPNKPKSLICDSEELRFQGGSLYSLRGNIFTNCDEIISLNLTKNNIAKMENHVFQNLSNLKQIDLSFNKIASLPADILSDTEDLENFHITDNRITSLPRNLFANLLYLKLVNFQFNNITYIEKNCFVNVPSLTTIVLADNNLKTLQFNIIDDLSSISLLYLNGNEWNCDQNLCEFMQTVVTRFWPEPFVPFCYFPNDIRGATFKEVIETPLPTVHSNLKNDPDAKNLILKCHTCSKSSLSWQRNSTVLTRKAQQTSGKYSTESTLIVYDFSKSDEGNYTCYVGDSCDSCESSTWVQVYTKVVPLRLDPDFSILDDSHFLTPSYQIPSFEIPAIEEEEEIPAGDDFSDSTTSYSYTGHHVGWSVGVFILAGICTCLRLMRCFAFCSKDSESASNPRLINEDREESEA